MPSIGFRAYKYCVHTHFDFILKSVPGSYSNIPLSTPHRTYKMLCKYKLPYYALNIEREKIFSGNPESTHMYPKLHLNHSDSSK